MNGPPESYVTKFSNSDGGYVRSDCRINRLLAPALQTCTAANGCEFPSNNDATNRGRRSRDTGADTRTNHSIASADVGRYRASRCHPVQDDVGGAHHNLRR